VTLAAPRRAPLRRWEWRPVAHAQGAPRFRTRTAGWDPGGPSLATCRSAQSGRVEVWRGDIRLGISVSAPFVWRCLSGSAMAPFPLLAYKRGEPRVCAVKAPTPEEEDRRRLLRVLFGETSKDRRAPPFPAVLLATRDAPARPACPRAARHRRSVANRSSAVHVKRVISATSCGSTQCTRDSTSGDLKRVDRGRRGHF